MTTLDFGFIDLNNDNNVEILVLRTGNNYQEWYIQILSLDNGDYIDSTDDFIDVKLGEGQTFYWMYIEILIMMELSNWLVNGILKSNGSILFIINGVC